MALGLGLGLGFETNLRGGSGYFSQKSLHESITVKSVEDHKDMRVRVRVGVRVRNQSPWW